MKLIPCAAAAAIAGLLLAGCEQVQQSSQRAPAVAPAPQSSALSPAADPSLPAADVASAKPAPDAAVTLYDSKKPEPSPAQATGSDASAHSALTADERDRQMPMKGQANDYNTPDRAKEGDQPSTASKEPGGQEANPGNQTQAVSSSGPR